MPTKALTPCSYPGCINLVRSGRCAEHPRVEVHRDPSAQRLYDRRWQARRKAHLSQHPWCEDCLEQGIYTAATDVHHEKRHGGDPLVFATSPLRSLCHVCHSRRTGVEVGMIKQEGGGV